MAKRISAQPVVKREAGKFYFLDAEGYVCEADKNKGLSDAEKQKRAAARKAEKDKAVKARKELRAKIADAKKQARKSLSQGDIARVEALEAQYEAMQ